MSLMSKLVKNEFKKEYKKTSTIIILALAFFLFIISTFFNYSINSVSSYPATYEEELKFYSEELETLKNNPDMFSSQEQKEVEIAFAEDKVSIIKQIMQYKVTICDDWRASLVDSSIQYKQACTFIDFVIDEKDAKLLENYSYYFNTDISGNDNTSPFDMRKSKLRQIKENLEEKLASNLSKIEENDYIAYAKEDLEEEKSNREETLNLISDFEKSYDASDKKAEYELKVLKENLKTLNDIIKTIEYRIENKIEYKDDWKNRTINAIVSAADQRDFFVPNIKEEYNGTIPYDKYIKETEKSRAENEDKITLYLYSLENNKPLFDMAESTRSLVTGLFGSFNYIAIIGILFAAVSVASEFNNGTIRLLLIRPVKRWKILISKYITVVSTCAVSAIALIVVTLIISIILNGPNDLIYPYISCVNSKITEINFFIWLMYEFLISFTSVLFISTFAFMLSTLSKNIPISIITSYLLMQVSSICALVGLISESIQNNVLNTIVSAIKYTPFLYFDMSMFVNYTKALDILSITNLDYNILIGVGWNILLTALLVFISTIKFVKQDIKN